MVTAEKPDATAFSNVARSRRTLLWARNSGAFLCDLIWFYETLVIFPNNYIMTFILCLRNNGESMNHSGFHVLNMFCLSAEKKNTVFFPDQTAHETFKISPRKDEIDDKHWENQVEDTEGGTGSSKTVSTTKMAVEPTKHGTLTNQTLEEQRAWDWTNYIHFIHKKMESTWNSGVWPAR